MRIGLIRQRYVQSGGAERYLHAVAEELVSRGHEIHVFAHTWTPGGTAGLYVHPVRRLKLTSALRALSFAWYCEKVVRQTACDVIFSLERTLRQDVYRAGDGCHREWLIQRARYTSKLKAAAVHLNPLHRTLLGLERRVFSPSRTGWIIANSSRGKDEILRHYPFPPERIVVIRNGVDARRFPDRAQAPGAGEWTLLFVGTGFERKGLRFCVEALARLPSRYRLAVAGKGATGPYEALASRLGVEGRVQFLGFDLDTSRLYPAAHILVHPAIYEPFANVCLEAMACGLPVVTSAANGAAEVIEHGRNGAVVADPADITGLASAIRLFEEPSAWIKASSAARWTAEAHSFDAHIEQTLAVLENACAHRANRTQSA
jgi:UDP-glucose:(heptosyl)LPS alpha-1,3-glucosyltransferase